MKTSRVKLIFCAGVGFACFCTCCYRAAVQESVARRAQRHEAVRSHEDFLKCDESKDSISRAIAIQELDPADVGGDVLEKLLHSVNDSDESVCVQAIQKLEDAVSRRSDIVDSLTRCLTRSKRIKVAAIQALARYDQAAAVAAKQLAQLLADDEDYEIRRFSAQTLGKTRVRPDVSVPALASSLRDDSDTVRITAAQSLRSYGTRAVYAVPALRLSLEDPNRSVRLMSISALAALGLPASSSLPRLHSLSSDGDPEIAAAARLAITRINE